LKPLIHRWTLCFRVCLLLGISQVAMAHSSATEEHLFKAAYIYNFAKLSSWPEGTWQTQDVTFNLCTLGNDDVIVALHKLSGKKIQGHEVAILSYADKPADKRCNLLYIAKAATIQPRKFIARQAHKALLTVSEIPDFLSMGGIIELYRENNRTRFKINTGNARQQGLEISSRLLNLAEVVDDRATK
jgi:hypothetical protein